MAFNPTSEHIAVTRASGITTVVTLPGSGARGSRNSGEGTVITGQGAIMHLEGWTWEEMAVKRSAMIDLLFPQLQSVSTRFGAFSAGPPRTFADEEKRYREQLQSMSQFFEQARRYQKAKAAGGPEFRSDIKLEAMIPVIEGKQPLFVRAEQERTIKDAVEFADKERVKIIIANPREIGVTGPLLKARNIPVVLGRFLNCRSGMMIPTMRHIRCLVSSTRRA